MLTLKCPDFFFWHCYPKGKCYAFVDMEKFPSKGKQCETTLSPGQMWLEHCVMFGQAVILLPHVQNYMVSSPLMFLFEHI